MRVGVFKSGADSGVYARDDEITLRPNTAATVPVAQNDISGDNTDLTVAKDVESQGIGGIQVVDNMLSFTTPKQAARITWSTPSRTRLACPIRRR